MTETLKPCSCAGQKAGGKDLEALVGSLFETATMTGLRLAVVERTSNALPVMHADIDTLFQKLADLAHIVQAIGERLNNLEAHVETMEDDRK